MFIASGQRHAGPMATGIVSLYFIIPCLLPYTEPASCTQYTAPASTSTNLSVSVSPFGGSVVTPENITVVQIYCGVHGIPPPTVAWFDPDGQQMFGGDYLIDTNPEDGSSQLSILGYDVSEDAGQYQCRVTNIGGEETCSVTLGGCNCVIGEWSEVSSKSCISDTCKIPFFVCFPLMRQDWAGGKPIAYTVKNGSLL